MNEVLTATTRAVQTFSIHTKESLFPEQCGGPYLRVLYMLALL